MSTPEELKQQADLSDSDISPDSISAEAPNDEEGQIVSAEGNEITGEHLVIRVGPKITKRRLDTYLCGRFSHFSRTHIQTLIKAQGVNVNSRPAKPSCKLNPDDIIDLIVPPKTIKSVTPQDIPLDIIFEDEEVIVLNKQANIIVHPARGNKDGTLVNGLMYYSNKLSSINGDFRPGIVHRLDRNTTGVMIVAKTDTAHWKLSRQFAERTTQKTYLAVVHGVPDLTADCVDQPIGMHGSFRERMAVKVDGKNAVSFYKVLEEFRGYALVELSPKTGRTHQLRVHMQYIKHPIVADDTYGGKVIYNWQVEDRPAQPEEPLIKRTALHAWRLEINHPITDERMTFEADPPKDIQNLIGTLRKYRKMEY